MREMRYDGNLFLLPENARQAGVVTTNGVRKANGRLVMGAGIAKYCRDNHRGIDVRLGDLVAHDGNHAYAAGTYRDPNRVAVGRPAQVDVLSMPTKHDWHYRSDVRLIRRSCRELMDIADRHGYERIYLPAPGCSNGGLDYASQVRGVLLAELDDRFTVCLPPDLFDHIPPLPEPDGQTGSDKEERGSQHE